MGVEVGGADCCLGYTKRWILMWISALVVARGVKKALSEVRVGVGFFKTDSLIANSFRRGWG